MRRGRAVEADPPIRHLATSWEREKETEKFCWSGSEGRVSQPGHPFAPGTRTMKQCLIWVKSALGALGRAGENVARSRDCPLLDSVEDQW